MDFESHLAASNACQGRSELRARVDRPATLTSRVRFHTLIAVSLSGRNSVVECQLPKLDVAGSTPVARSFEALVPQGLSHWTGPHDV